MLAQTVCQYRGSNPGGDENFRTRSDRPWSAPSLLYEWDRVIYPAVEAPGRGVDHPPLSIAEVKERVNLYTTSTPLQDLRTRYREKLTFSLHLFDLQIYTVAVDMAAVLRPADMFITVAVSVFYFINKMVQA